MARGKIYDVFKRDTLLFNFLREHKGKENIVSSADIENFLAENGYSHKKVSAIVQKIMYEFNAPICSVNTKGYYWATSRDELLNTIEDLESRICSLQAHINHLKGFMI